MTNCEIAKAFMITLINNNLDFNHKAELVSCQFDVEQFKLLALQEHEHKWGVSVPQRIQNAIDKRKAEFIAGRYCAKKAIQQVEHKLSDNLGLVTIDIGEKRQPLWPSRFVGSITHSHGFAAAVVADSTIVRSVGIDSEFRISEKTANNISSHILTEEESYSDNNSQVASSIDYLTLIFSAKESIFKCLHPLVLQYFDFQDAVVSLSPTMPNHFEYHLQKHLSNEFCVGYKGQGQFCFNGDFVHTAVLIAK